MSAAAAVIDLVSDDEETPSTVTDSAKRDGAAFTARSEKRFKTEFTNAGQLVLCLDDDSSDGEDSAAPPLITPPAAACLDPRFSTVTQASHNEDVIEVAPPPAQQPARWKRGDEEEKKDEDDVAIVGSTGFNALADFPHSRENCVTHPHADDPFRHCLNCYCYVCDIHASECKAWREHCGATHGEARWQKLRQEYRERGGHPPMTAAPPTTTRAVTAQPRNPLIQPMSQTLLPAGHHRMDSRPDLEQYSLRALLEHVMGVHPVERSPPPGLFQTNLRHYQRQSLAFMLEAERRTVREGQVRGGWLADELGMGKSAVVLALIAANPMTQCPSLAQVRAVLGSSTHSQAKDESTDRSRLKIKATVIMTSVSLMGQWEDECQKHCPALVISRFHSTGKRILTRDNLHRLDVIISSSTFEWPSSIVGNFEFHRVVVDESHLFATAPSSARIKFAVQVPSEHRWCVTGTPCTGSVRELIVQLRFLNSTGRFYKKDQLLGAISAFQSPGSTLTKKRAFYALADELKLCMIRHTKAQRVNGSQALALPESTTTTLFLDMSTAERNLFGQAHLSTDAVNRLKQLGGTIFGMERCFLFRMKDILPEQEKSLTKINALVHDLRELRRREPTFRAVVFTQYTNMHRFCVRALGGEDMTIFEFSGSTGPKKRDSAIRAFQSQADRRPAVFIITLRSGNVGITLTAASRVYLLEPSIDPAAEVQAAGRIHRLGQSKSVQVKKFVFKNSVEANIVDLHKEVAAGRIAISDGHVPPAAVRILAKGIHSRT